MHAIRLAAAVKKITRLQFCLIKSNLYSGNYFPHHFKQHFKGHSDKYINFKKAFHNPKYKSFVYKVKVRNVLFTNVAKIMLRK